MIKLTLSWEDKHGETGQTSYEFENDFDLPKLLKQLIWSARKAWVSNEVLIKDRNPNPPEEELPCVL